MDGRNLIHPMTAGDLVHSACVLAIQERGMGAETETGILECVSIAPHGMVSQDGGKSAYYEDGAIHWPLPGSRADVTFRDRLHGGLLVLTLKPDTPLLFTGIRL